MKPGRPLLSLTGVLTFREAGNTYPHNLSRAWQKKKLYNSNDNNNNNNNNNNTKRYS